MPADYRNDYPYNYGRLSAAVRLFLAGGIGRKQLADTLRMTQKALEYPAPAQEDNTDAPE